MGVRIHRLNPTGNVDHRQEGFKLTATGTHLWCCDV